MAGAGDLLLLFDIDGTLMAGATAAHAAAVHQAICQVHSLSAVDRSLTRAIDPAGRTDPEISRAILLAHGVSAERIDARADDVRVATGEIYAQTCPADLSEFVLPGVPELLGALAARDDVRLSLVTGNYETVARVKLRAAGVGQWFASGQGGFGSDSEDRTDLPAVARARASHWEFHDGEPGTRIPGGNSRIDPHPRERTVVIGDTPRDVACALADDVRCIGVETGSFAAAELTAAGAHAVAADTAALAAAIDALV
ncbi:HAD family hydrolase [Conexibacter stalactiti]|uniref:HAD family hydrolase n=1 Tax=Conexibacter stalactiti TaxID=1940611 RepID=A0ABU4HMS5_9ACTN|nr:HAD family hydrolase [Conexibacter stalactiti]MDW5594606.1 HAD family hydrolase [Conexibacter stalactiti]MEC5035248.1 HAD family hydrolase [Conexibacter stalactiti]